MSGSTILNACGGRCPQLPENVWRGDQSFTVVDLYDECHHRFEVNSNDRMEAYRRQGWAIAGSSGSRSPDPTTAAGATNVTGAAGTNKTILAEQLGTAIS